MPMSNVFFVVPISRRTTINANKSRNDAQIVRWKRVNVIEKVFAFQFTKIANYTYIFIHRDRTIITTTAVLRDAQRTTEETKNYIHRVSRYKIILHPAEWWSMEVVDAVNSPFSSHLDTVHSTNVRYLARFFATWIVIYTRANTFP